MTKQHNITESFMQRTLVVWLGALLCCALWGSAFPSIKIGYQMFQITPDDTATQILFAGMRFALAGIIALILGSVLQRKVLVPQKKSIGKILKLSMLQTVGQYIFFYIGLANTTGVKASIIEGVNVFLAILVASLLFRLETLHCRKVAGCVIGFIGVILVNLSGSQFDLHFQFIGEGFIFLSAVAYAFSSVFLKRYSEQEDPVILSGYQFIAGGVILMLIGFCFGGRIAQLSVPAAGMLLYLALISAVAYSLWGILLKYNPVSRVAVFGFMNPVFGVLLSALWLRETDSIGVLSILALVLVCIGIYVVNRESGTTASI